MGRFWSIFWYPFLISLKCRLRAMVISVRQRLSKIVTQQKMGCENTDASRESMGIPKTNLPIRRLASNFETLLIRGTWELVTKPLFRSLTSRTDEPSAFCNAHQLSSDCNNFLHQLSNNFLHQFSTNFNNIHLETTKKVPTRKTSQSRVKKRVKLGQKMTVSICFEQTSQGHFPW